MISNVKIIGQRRRTLAVAVLFCISLQRYSIYPLLTTISNLTTEPLQWNTRLSSRNGCIHLWFSLPVPWIPRIAGHDHSPPCCYSKNRITSYRGGWKRKPRRAYYTYSLTSEPKSEFTLQYTYLSKYFTSSTTECPFTVRTYWRNNGPNNSWKGLLKRYRNHL